VPNSHNQAWRDWGSVDPLYAILTDPKYRHGGGDRAEFLSTGEGLAAGVLGHCDELGLPKEFGRALDFGCGVGRLTAPLSVRFEEILGLDVSDNMIATARDLHAERPNCQFEVHGGADLHSYPDATFDLVFCVLVLQHLGSQEAILLYLKEFVRVLRPGGALVFQLPSKVASPSVMPPWRTRAGRRVRTAAGLRRLGVSPKVLYRRFDWVPEMTMTGIPEDLTRSTLVACGARIVFETPVDVDRGGTESRIFFATR
jgi:SAM-dependent methyltransferase